eukprot:19500-Heterococcus_DN1.PRE.1
MASGMRTGTHAAIETALLVIFRGLLSGYKCSPDWIQRNTAADHQVQTCDNSVAPCQLSKQVNMYTKHSGGVTSVTSSTH